MRIPVTVRFLGGAQYIIGIKRVTVDLDDRVDCLIDELNNLFSERLRGNVGREYLVNINRMSYELFIRKHEILKPTDIIAIITPFAGG